MAAPHLRDRLDALLGEPVGRPVARDRFVPRDLEHPQDRSEEHTSELQSQSNLVCRLLLEKKKKNVDRCDYQKDERPDGGRTGPPSAHVRSSATHTPLHCHRPRPSPARYTPLNAVTVYKLL